MSSRNKLYEQFHKNRSRVFVGVPKTRDFTYRSILPHLVKLLKKGHRVLDIGCGNGALSFFAASRGCQVLGVDISKKAILGCQFNAKRLGFVRNLKFQVINFNNPQVKVEDKFDLVICSEVIEHLNDDVSVLKNIYEQLKPGGLFFLSTPSINSPIHRFRTLFYKTDYFDKEVGHLRRYELNKLVLLLKETNYKILKTYKTEGVLRNFFFVTKIGAKLQWLLRRGIRDIISIIDSGLLFLGECDLIIIASKPK